MPMASTPLRPVHAAAGAQFADEEALPRDYDDAAAEYRAIREGVAVIDLSPAGKLEASGKNAVQFINGLVTNDVKSLRPGDGTLAAFLNVQGKVVAICRFYQTGDHLLIELDAAARSKVYQNLSRFVPAGEFLINDVTGRDALVSLQGPRSPALIAALTGEPAAEPEYKFAARRIDGRPVSVATHSRAGERGFDLFIPAETATEVWGAILARGAEFGARAVGQDALEIARIEAGIPREGVDVNENYILLEAGYERAVSYTKGCYLGQEIIARIHWRGQPAKRLTGLLVEAPEAPPRGAELYAADGKRVGEVTSSTHSPALGRPVALGYVHRYYLTPGTTLTVKREAVELGRAEVTALPFTAKQQPAPVGG